MELVTRVQAAYTTESPREPAHVTRNHLLDFILDNVGSHNAID